MQNRFSGNTEEKIQGWFFDDNHRKEKDTAVRGYFDAMPTFESEYSRRTLKEIKVRLGFTTNNRHVLRRRLVLRAAAVLLPVMIAVGSALLYNNITDRAAHTQTLMAVVDDGIQQHITLPDNSQVWLNHGSEIEYPSAFGKSRDVTISGEAFFNVSRDEKRPFTVKAGGLSVRVLGTEFNVNARPGSPKTTVTLISGSVEVNAAGRTIDMQPLDKLEYDRNTNEIAVTTISPDEYDWRSIMLNFEKMMLGDVLNAIGKYYGVEITSTSLDSYNEPISLRLSGNESIERVMQMLDEISGKFKYHISEDKIVIQPHNHSDQ